MLDTEPGADSADTTTPGDEPGAPATTPAQAESGAPAARARTTKAATAKKAPAKRAPRTTKKAAAAAPSPSEDSDLGAPADEPVSTAAPTAADAPASDGAPASGDAPDDVAPVKKARKRATRKTAAPPAAPAVEAVEDAATTQPAEGQLVLGDTAESVPAAAKTSSDDALTAPAAKTPRRRSTRKAAPAAPAEPIAAESSSAADQPTDPTAVDQPADDQPAPTAATDEGSASGLFVAPVVAVAPPTRQRTRRGQASAPLFQAPVESPVDTLAPAVSAPTEASTTPFDTSFGAPEPTSITEPSDDAQPTDEPAPPTSSRSRSRSRSRSSAARAAAAEAAESDAVAIHSEGDVTEDAEAVATADQPADATLDASADDDDDTGADGDGAATATAEASSSRRRRRRGGRGRRRKPAGEDGAAAEGGDGDATAEDDDNPAVADGSAAQPASSRSSRSRSGRDASGSAPLTDDSDATTTDAATADAETESRQDDEAASGETKTSSSSRRRRSRRRAGESTDAPAADDPPQTVVRVREPRTTTSSDDDVTSLKGSTRLEAKKQRRRDGRDQGRRRPPVITEAEFLARRESVDRVMVVRQSGSRTQIAVLEDGVLVEHYVAHSSQTSSVGNVYLGKVQNVLPAMEAAFIDIGKGRNAVLYAGEVAWSRMGMDGKARRMESALSSGQSILVQVTKDPVGHKGARLTGLVSLPGRFLVYAPGGSMSGISRKLPEKERARLKGIVKKVFPDEASVIIRTAAEGASEDELSQDIHRLEAQWLDIEAKAKTATAPTTLYAEPDLAIKVVRDMFNEDFASLVVSGDEAWQTLQPYVEQVAPDLVERLTHWTSERDIFSEYRIDEQIAKALDRKVWLPSGGSLVIDRTEAMTVVDVNTGKFTGSGGNLEATVTKNNLEAAEEIVRQIRLRDIGGIIVIDFIDMVLENNRDLVLRRLVECLGRDRTRHQVAEVTSLGLVQMTRKRVGQGLLDVFSEPCEHCNGRGVKIHYEPIESVTGEAHEQTPQPARGGRSEQSGRSGRSRGGAPAAVDGPPRPGPADVIRAVALAAANSRAAAGVPAEDQVDDELAEQFSDDAADTDDFTHVLDDVEAVAPDDDDTAPSDADDLELDAVADEVTVTSDETADRVAPTEHLSATAEASLPSDADLLDTETPESGHAPARRSRRTRSTRRPAGPPRPTQDGAIDATPVVVVEPEQSASTPDTASRSNGISSPSPAVTSEETSAASSSQDAPAAAGSDAATDQPSSRPRRRRVTRPAGAPAS